MTSLLWLAVAALAGPFVQPSFKEVDTGDIFDSWGCRPSRDTFAACLERNLAKGQKQGLLTEWSHDGSVLSATVASGEVSRLEWWLSPTGALSLIVGYARVGALAIEPARKHADVVLAGAKGELWLDDEGRDWLVRDGQVIARVNELAQRTGNEAGPGWTFARYEPPPTPPAPSGPSNDTWAQGYIQFGESKSWTLTAALGAKLRISLLSMEPTKLALWTEGRLVVEQTCGRSNCKRIATDSLGKPYELRITSVGTESHSYVLRVEGEIGGLSGDGRLEDPKLWGTAQDTATSIGRYTKDDEYGPFSMWGERALHQWTWRGGKPNGSRRVTVSARDFGMWATDGGPLLFVPEDTSGDYWARADAEGNVRLMVFPDLENARGEYGVSYGGTDPERDFEGPVSSWFSSEAPPPAGVSSYTPSSPGPSGPKPKPVDYTVRSAASEAFVEMDGTAFERLQEEYEAEAYARSRAKPRPLLGHMSEHGPVLLEIGYPGEDLFVTIVSRFGTVPRVFYARNCNRKDADDGSDLDVSIAPRDGGAYFILRVKTDAKCLGIVPKTGTSDDIAVYQMRAP